MSVHPFVGEGGCRSLGSHTSAWLRFDTHVPEPDSGSPKEGHRLTDSLEARATGEAAERVLSGGEVLGDSGWEPPHHQTAGKRVIGGQVPAGQSSSRMRADIRRRNAG